MCTLQVCDDDDDDDDAVLLSLVCNNGCILISSMFTCLCVQPVSGVLCCLCIWMSISGVLGDISDDIQLIIFTKLFVVSASLGRLRRRWTDNTLESDGQCPKIKVGLSLNRPSCPYESFFFCVKLLSSSNWQIVTKKASLLRASENGSVLSDFALLKVSWSMHLSVCLLVVVSQFALIEGIYYKTEC